MDTTEALTRAQAGDHDAIAALYRAFAPPLFGFLMSQVRRREDAEDLLGEVFLAAFRDLEGFSGDISGFRAWLYRIASNRAIDLVRRNRRRPEEPLDAAEHHPSHDDTEAEAVARDERHRLWAAVAGLPEEQRRVVALRLSGGLSAIEIGRILGKRPGAVKALQHRALANLTRALRGGARANPYLSQASERLEG